ncbi:MAG: hypothetical protein FVQ86_10445 [candidate division NC10 bacterium]|nr:hypothetical protein [candidate division NC10 bacterium]
MKINVHKIIKATTPWTASLLLIIFVWGSSIAVGATSGSRSGNQYRRVEYKIDTVNILSVLNKRIGDKQLLKKAKDKLSRLDDAEIRLIASLCDQISGDGRKVGTDIAFLLVMVLIILS